MDSLVMGIGIMLAVMGAGLAIVEVGLGLVLLGMGALVTLVGYGMVRAQVTRMPFRVYERGFTKTSVPFSQGLKRRESLVYHDMLEKVTIDSTSF
ncbi:MAG: hypothetical protein GWN97_05345, partial [Thermoplasmata archaeon]|nr:hypothetical protein [Thermoplasmata archaeon]NIS11352.1 hypothetical protein [Thermoplasmata archaeon]